MIQLGSFYFNPQIALISNHFFMGMSVYWGVSKEARYLTIHIGILNLSMDFNMGIRTKTSEENE